MALKCKLTHDKYQMSTWYLFICNVEDSMADTNKNHTNKQTNKAKQKTENRKTQQNMREKGIYMFIFGLKCYYLR